MSTLPADSLVAMLKQDRTPGSTTTNPSFHRIHPLDVKHMKGARFHVLLTLPDSSLILNALELGQRRLVVRHRAGNCW